MSLAVVTDRGVTGTIGAMLALGDRTYLVTCHHLLFGESGAGERLWAYDPESRTRIAELGCFVWGRSGRVTHGGSASFVDVALGMLSDPSALPARVRDALGETITLDHVATPIEHSAVAKRGAATADTVGTITTCRHYESIEVRGRSQHAPGQILIHGADRDPFCAAGDSGAAVVDQHRRVVALLWGCRRDGSGCASPIEAVVARVRESEGEIRRASDDLDAARRAPR